VVAHLARRTFGFNARIGWVALLLLVASCGGTCGTIQAEPIEGYWAWEGDGVQQITSLGSGDFQGAIVKASTSIGKCAAPVGRVVLKLHGSATHYTGQDEWFREANCVRRFSTDAVVDLTNGNNTAHLCSTGPFTDVAPVSNCEDLARLPNYTPQ
jgi:hypothetical protein